MTTAASRPAILRRFIEENHLAGWFSWRADELVMQAGHLPFWGLSFLLVLEDGPIFLFVPELEPQDTVPDNTIVITYPWGNPGCINPFESLRQQIQGELSKRHISLKSIGFLRESSGSSLPLMAAEQPPLPPGSLDLLVRGMTANAQLETAFLRLYLHKTETEIQGIRLANKVAQIGLDAWSDALVPGVTEAEAAAVAEATIHSLIGQHGIESARAWAMVQSGNNTAQSGRFNRSSGRRIRTGDLALIELATCVNGYWSDLTRTVTIGHSSNAAAEILDAISEAQRAAIKTIMPGVSARDVDASARNSLRQAGFAEYFTHGTGHHTGFRYHDPGFLISADSCGTLETGMVITIEPGVYIPEKAIGARIEENIAVASDGADILSTQGKLV